MRNFKVTVSGIVRADTSGDAEYLVASHERDAQAWGATDLMIVSVEEAGSDDTVDFDDLSDTELAAAAAAIRALRG